MPTTAPDAGVTTDRALALLDTLVGLSMHGSQSGQGSTPYNPSVLSITLGHRETSQTPRRMGKLACDITLGSLLTFELHPVHKHLLLASHPAIGFTNNAPRAATHRDVSM